MLKGHTQLSPLLETCCLLLSTNESYAHAAQDIEVLTGRSVSHSTQQRLVHRQELSSMDADCTIEELSVDGGKVRIRTPLAQPFDWRDYKAIRLHEHTIGQAFRRTKYSLSGLISNT